MAKDRSTKWVRVVALFGVPAALVAAIALSFVEGLTPQARVLVVFGGGAAAALALIAPWLLARLRS